MNAYQNEEKRIYLNFAITVLQGDDAHDRTPQVKVLLYIVQQISLQIQQSIVDAMNGMKASNEAICLLASTDDIQDRLWVLPGEQTTWFFFFFTTTMNHRQK